MGQDVWCPERQFRHSKSHKADTWYQIKVLLNSVIAGLAFQTAEQHQCSVPLVSKARGKQPSLRDEEIHDEKKHHVKGDEQPKVEPVRVFR